jgi:transposase
MSPASPRKRRTPGRSGTAGYLASPPHSWGWIMAVICTHGAGLDGPQKRVTACRVIPEPAGQHAEGIPEVKDFGTMTRDLLAWADWLAAVGITPVALESTGDYWRPVDHLLEGDLTVFLANAAHVKQVPGRQTDNNAARWLAKLMRDGLLQASVIPPQGPREWRELTRDRTTVVQARRREGNRVPGVLERATIKVAAVATDLRGGVGTGDLGGINPGASRPGDDGGAGPRPDAYDAPTAGASADRGRARAPPSVAGDAIGPW